MCAAALSHWPVLVVFVATYALIAARRLTVLPIGRPAGALVGACALVLLAGVDPRWGLTPTEAFAAVEPNTIALLLGMMLMTAALAEAGFFERAAAWVAARRPSPVGLLWSVTLGAGALSAVLVNDPVCLLLAPLVDATARRARLARVPYLLALAMGANAGSAMTLAGNPQNMLVAHLGALSYRAYLVRGGPAGLIALLVTAAVLHLMTHRRLVAGGAGVGAGAATIDAEAAPPPASPTQRLHLRLALAVLAAVSVAFVAGASLAWSALAGATLLMLVRRRDPGPLFTRVSWTLLVFFGALFVVVAGLQKTGLPEAALRATAPWMPVGRAGGVAGLAAALVAGCQVVSNVPFILLAAPWIRTLPDPRLAWTTTAVVSTLAGNLTLLGSVANIIVVETAHAEEDLRFLTYLRVGVPVTLASTVAAVGWLLLVS
jgi:Na+/H+ antiporter NhaD/arsenite permease-like protein